jgi:beta-galactosidase
MTGEQMNEDEMDEPHPYQGRRNPSRPYTEKEFYQLGNLDYKPAILRNIQQSKSAQLANEYGWIWFFPWLFY